MRIPKKIVAVQQECDSGRVELCSLWRSFTIIMGLALNCSGHGINYSAWNLKRYGGVMPWFVTVFVCKQFGSQTETFCKILFLSANSISGDRCDPSCRLSSTNTNVAIFSKIVEQ
ncbi:hypothetical protein H920_06900 [Fukomys damarensis]|uniref:Uncharacterized protein n=1 Tax=Fukomys damarensis TaxID=885580 RepID=A0A091E955_FUKDA|nr:hypothetical protein H920_06900 [Fukomys damarensis]